MLLYLAQQDGRVADHPRHGIPDGSLEPLGAPHGRPTAVISPCDQTVAPAATVDAALMRPHAVQSPAAPAADRQPPEQVGPIASRSTAQQGRVAAEALAGALERRLRDDGRHGDRDPIGGRLESTARRAAIVEGGARIQLSGQNPTKRRFRPPPCPPRRDALPVQPVHDLAERDALEVPAEHGANVRRFVWMDGQSARLR